MAPEHFDFLQDTGEDKGDNTINQLVHKDATRAMNAVMGADFPPFISGKIKEMTTASKVVTRRSTINPLGQYWMKYLENVFVDF
jgi:hypothetical protein